MQSDIQESIQNLSELKFKGTWRSYQKRVLDELNKHLNDKKLNVVAAPGAGKTTLGIEVVRRLNFPALILAPTITIRNQWALRIKSGFLENETKSDFISTDINNIKKITITTYQSLHSVFKKDKEFDKFLSDLKKQNVKTLVLDEAHHLRTEWYKTLSKLTEKMDCKQFTVVSLTATPPYDVSINEWRNYNSLCGCTDAEISIPELVKNSDLCPHQDLIYFCDLSKEESAAVLEYEKNRESFFNDLKKDPDFASSVETSTFLNAFEKNIELIYEDINFSVSLISYLLFNDSMNPNAFFLAEFLALDISLVPKFDYIQAEILINGILGKFEKYFERTFQIKDKLKKLKLLSAPKKVDFSGNNILKNVYTRSKNKLKAIVEITQCEYNVLNDNLREVILLDYIGKGDSLGLNIFSVFEKLKVINIEMAILTGSLIVIPESAKEKLYEILNKFNIDSKNVLTASFKSEYLRVEAYGNVDLVPAITELFRIGSVKILIGTQALLGEGWDSPCTNTLIIASTIGSFMTSNQMRGRALRIDKDNPDKNADIWHIAAIHNNKSNSDIDTIIKRFNTFEGISFIDDKIQNGIERLGLPSYIFNSDYESENTLELQNINTNINDLNNIMLSRAKKRKNLKTLWNQAFEKSEITEKNMIKQVYDVAQTENTSVPAVYTDIVNSKFKCFFNSKIKNKYLNIIHQEYQYLGEILYSVLSECEIINNPLAKVKVEIKTDLTAVSITLLNCTNYERNIFVKSFNEIFTFNENARYIMKKCGDYSFAHEQNKKYFKIFNFIFSFYQKKYTMPENIFKSEQYYFVPEIIGNKKSNIEILIKKLLPYFGYFETIYTRVPNGRKELIKVKYLQTDSRKIKKCRLWI